MLGWHQGRTVMGCAYLVERDAVNGAERTVPLPTLGVIVRRHGPLRAAKEVTRVKQGRPGRGPTDEAVMVSSSAPMLNS